MDSVTYTLNIKRLFIDEYNITWDWKNKIKGKALSYILGLKKISVIRNYWIQNTLCPDYPLQITNQQTYDYKYTSNNTT